MQNASLLLTQISEYDKAKFWTKVNIARHDECWLWTAATESNGYGRIKINGKNESSHRISYAIFNGGVPKGLAICHSCDVRNCVNPRHLWCGTLEDNNRDMCDKGRNSVNHLRFRIYGDPMALITSAKLSESEVRKIREEFSGGVTVAELAVKFNVGKSSIYRAVKNKAWKHIQ